MNRPNAPPNAGRHFYFIMDNGDGTADVLLRPRDRLMIVKGVVPWDGMEADIRARYGAWCDAAALVEL